MPPQVREVWETSYELLLTAGTKNASANPPDMDRINRREEEVMKSVGRIWLALGIVALAWLVNPVPPSMAAEAGVKAGILTCNVASGFGFILGSSKEVKCTYAPVKGAAEYYTGTISKFGADIGYSQAAVIVWAIVAPTSDIKPGALAGTYAGATGGASVGVGVGAHVLLGGLDQSISLQPVSFEGNTGLNVAAGIEALKLEPAK
jgi:hypothetical protein